MRRPPVGARPGELAIDPSWPPPRVRVVAYDHDQVDEYEEPEGACDLARIRSIIDSHAVTWVDVQGLGNAALLESIAESFSLHPLAIADVVNVPQRPKAESYEDYIFLITKMITLEEDSAVKIEQVSAFLGPNYLLTFQEHYGDVWDPVRDRIRSPNTRIRGEKVDYLAYAVLDAVIDGYYPVLEEMGERLLDMEEDALRSPTEDAIKETNRIRRSLLSIRRVLWPQREAVSSLIRDPTPLVSDPVRLFLRDAYDHCAQGADLIESYREILNGVANLHLTGLSNRANDVMKLLTIMASIFIPLTFLAGIYGMNFEYMPELHDRYGYPVVLVIMLIIAVSMVLYFRKKGWIGTQDNHRRWRFLRLKRLRARKSQEQQNHSEFG